MRLMTAVGSGAGELVWMCLYCEAQAEPQAMYETVYCYCRTTGVERDALSTLTPAERAA